MDGQSYILRRLDDPWKIALWELDVALPFITCLFFGVIRGTVTSLLVGVVAAIVAGRVIGRIKAMRHPGYFKHLIWWLLPSEISFSNAFPPSNQQEMIG
jgi:type IV conjugative transfer system protein TraL